MKTTKLKNGGELIEFTQAEMDEMQGRIAKDAGMTLEAYRAMLNEHMKADWCQCEKPGDPVFCPDGRSRNQHCVTKHHYHCENCMKLIQVG